MGFSVPEQMHLHPAAYYVLLMALNVAVAVVFVAACLWCNKKNPKNELLGLEGMVKLKNPDEVVVVTAVGNSESQADLNASTVSNADSEKRASTAAHRSLPDIPVAEASGDDGSDLYETQTHFFSNATHNLKKQSSISQHSSISQADDSPYSRVKNSPHDYAKVRTTEHPYAQLTAPNSTATTVVAASSSGAVSNQLPPSNDSTLHRNSHHSDSTDGLHEAAAPQAEIPAASAIAGMVSASQDLPYMTPPIANQHFSGDSQDSSKGYTSISVREPLANILASQVPVNKTAQRIATLSRDVSDSHYATVSDDSDETYAAIEDPTGRNNPHVVANTTDIYTSGSETYAQIQPMQSNTIIVSVEINNTSSATTSMPAVPTTVPTGTTPAFDHNSVGSVGAAGAGAVASVGVGSSSSSNQITMVRNSYGTSHTHTQNHSHNRPTSDHSTPMPLHLDNLRAQMHSRQASSSSNNSTSCVGSLGSPKPEKRQANSPLPPTPKSSQMHATSNSNLTSGRNSVISVIECGGALPLDANGSSESSPQKKHKSLSPSKDIEGMYAKVMKKAKFSRNSPSSQDSSPVLARKYEHSSALGVSPLDAATAELMDTHKVNMSTVGGGGGSSSSRVRSNSYSAKDHGYETIPADSMRNPAGGAAGAENRKSDCYTHILQKERQLEEGSPMGYTNAKPTTGSVDFMPSSIIGEKHYETIASKPTSTRNNDPGYETLLKPKHQFDADNEKKSSDYDPNYEVLKDPQHLRTSTSAGLSDDGYAKVIEKKRRLTDVTDADSTDGYSKVKGDDGDDGTVGYSTIGEGKDADLARDNDDTDTDANHNYASILETKGFHLKERNAFDSESDHYARIAETRIAPPNEPALPLTAVSSPAATIPEEDGDSLTPRLPELPSITSPSSNNSSSLLNNSSATNITTTSTMSTMSSRQTPSSSQYESLTGSDTDPNYESVCYMNSSTSENPYERLQADYSDPQLSSPSPLTTPETEQRSTAHMTSTAKKCTSNGGPKPPSNPHPTIEVVVDDYFQV